MKYCPYCGTGLDADMLFCPSCGKPFDGGKENPHLAGKAVSEDSPAEEHTAKAPEEVKVVYVKAEQEAPAPKKKRGGLIALIACIVILATVGGLFATGVFTPIVRSFSENTEAIANASDSVVMLSCYDKNGELYSTGSGFAIFEDGVIATNYHVIEKEVYRVKAETESGHSFECSTVLAYDAERDIAILKADRKTELALLTPGDSEALQKGEKVVAIGSPLGLINSVSTGVFSGYIDDKTGRMLQFTAAISHGSSGGALFNDAGEVIGITFASLTAGQSLNLAVPMIEVQRLYENSNPTKAMSIKAFYDTFDHTPPIPTYTIEYVVSHFEELLDTVFNVDCWVSSYHFNNSLIGGGTVGVIYCVGDKKDITSSIERDVRGVYYGTAINVHILMSGYDTALEQLKSGDHVIVCCNGAKPESFQGWNYYVGNYLSIQYLN